MAKTAKGLVDYCKAQLGKPYWYGTFGNKATQSLLTSKTNQYPAHYTNGRMSKYKSQIGERVHDCVGLIKGYLWSETSTSTPKYNSAQDESANGMRGRCKESGLIATLPEIPGVLVFFSGHVGVYIGKGRVIEARGFNYGVVETELKDRPWTHWGKCPWIEYPDVEETKPVVKEEKPATPKVVYFPKYDGKSLLIDTVFKAIGVPSSMRGKYKNRMPIAKANGISDYKGKAEQNLKLISLAKAGKLIKP
jgi:hypothetical protein